MRTAMGVKRSLPRRPARWYPAGSVLTFRDGREFIVDEHEVRIYEEFGSVNNEEDYLYSKWRRYWRQIR